MGLWGGAAFRIVTDELGKCGDHLITPLLLPEQKGLLLESQFSFGSFWVAGLKQREISCSHLEILLPEVQESSLSQGRRSPRVIRTGLDEARQSRDRLYLQGWVNGFRLICCGLSVRLNESPSLLVKNVRLCGWRQVFDREVVIEQGCFDILRRHEGGLGL